MNIREKKEIYEYLNIKNEYDKRLDNIIKEINKNKEFEFLDNYRIKIHNLIEKKEKKEIIEDKFKELENRIDQVKKSQKFRDSEFGKTYIYNFRIQKC